MRRMRWAMYLWPGLAQLWLGGRWFGLAVAVCAAAVLNLALLTTFVWVELLPQGARSALWLAAAAGWVISALFSVRWRSRQKALEQPDLSKDTFGEAIDHYLKGNWFETERVLAGLLRQNPRDVDARLMLATLLRHTGRTDEAGQELDRLARLENADKWQLEIHRERELLGRPRGNNQAETNEIQTTGKTTDKIETEQAAGSRSGDPPSSVVHAA